MGTGGLAAWIERHLWAVVAALAAVWSGYLTGQAVTKSQIESMTVRIDRIERVEAARRPFMSCAVRTIDMLRAGVKGVPPCVLEVPE